MKALKGHAGKRERERLIQLDKLTSRIRGKVPLRPAKLQVVDVNDDDGNDNDDGDDDYDDDDDDELN